MILLFVHMPAGNPNPPVAVRFLHIAKTAGYSLGEMIHRCRYTPLSLLPQNYSYGAEFCFRNLMADHLWPSWQQTPGTHVVRMTTLRSPREHVLSQYKQCRFGHWNPWVGRSEVGKHQPLFPAGEADGGEYIVGGFRQWLQHFQTWNVSNGDWHCYHPRSMQARALTCSLGAHTSGHHVLSDESQAIFPDAEQAIANMRSIEHVGMVDLFYESWCLLLFKVGTRPLPDSCDCTAREEPSGARVQQARGAHATDELHTNEATSHTTDDVNSVKVINLPHDVLELIDTLSEADARLFSAGALRVIRELREAERQTGTSLLCTAALTQFVNATSYIPNLAKQLQVFSGT